MATRGVRVCAVRDRGFVVVVIRARLLADPVLIDTGLTMSAMRWNTYGSVLAIAGCKAMAGSRATGCSVEAAVPSTAAETMAAYMVQFYDPFGRVSVCLRSFFLPVFLLSHHSVLWACLCVYCGPVCVCVLWACVSVLWDCLCVCTVGVPVCLYCGPVGVSVLWACLCVCTVGLPVCVCCACLSVCALGLPVCVSVLWACPCVCLCSGLARVCLCSGLARVCVRAADRAACL